MSETTDVGHNVATARYDIDLDADVLVIGGSLAGAWAALTAAEAGAKVVVAEKAWLGTAGVVAAATSTGYYLLPDNPEQRARTITLRHKEACGFDDLVFIERVYENSSKSYLKLIEWGFRPGRPGIFRGPDSMVFLRRQLLRRRIRILDCCPALELLQSDGGEIAGAAGIHRKTGKTWRVTAGAVILATGANAFRSGVIGTHGITGDGYLLAAEAGAEFVGMEFSGHYGFAPAGNSCTKVGLYYHGSIFDESGNKLDDEPGWAAVPAVAKAMIDGRKVFAIFDKVAPENRQRYRHAMQNLFQYFDRMDIDPYTQLFPIELRYEGTVRATGGLIIGDDCSTSVPGLYAAGDITDRTKLTGVNLSGAGAAVAWCVASAEWSGKAAAIFAANIGPLRSSRRCRALGRCGLRPASGMARTVRGREIIRSVQEEILPLEKNAFRDAAKLSTSLARLQDLWTTGRDDLAGIDVRDVLKAREAAAMVATGRWMYSAAKERKETRGLHRRTDYPFLDPSQRFNFRVGGLEEITVRSQPL